MNMVVIPPSTTVTTDAARITQGGAGSFLGNIIVSIINTTTGSVLISDEPNGANANILITNGGAANGIYTININAYSKTGNWYIGTGGGARVFATVGRPKS